MEINGDSANFLQNFLGITESIIDRMSDQTLSNSAGDTGDSASISQVRIQLSTRHPDIALPENPGPILVNTSNVI